MATFFEERYILRQSRALYDLHLEGKFCLLTWKWRGQTVKFSLPHLFSGPRKFCTIDTFSISETNHVKWNASNFQLVSGLIEIPIARRNPIGIRIASRIPMANRNGRNSSKQVGILPDCRKSWPSPWLTMPVSLTMIIIIVWFSWVLDQWFIHDNISCN